MISVEIAQPTPAPPPIASPDRSVCSLRPYRNSSSPPPCLLARVPPTHTTSVLSKSIVLRKFVADGKGQTLVLVSKRHSRSFLFAAAWYRITTICAGGCHNIVHPILSEDGCRIPVPAYHRCLQPTACNIPSACCRGSPGRTSTLVSS